MGLSGRQSTSSVYVAVLVAAHCQEDADSFDRNKEKLTDHCSFYDNNVYYYDMIQTNSRIESGGDSGGVCFKISSGTSAKVVGIVRGYAYGKSVFVKAANILSGLGVTIY